MIRGYLQFIGNAFQANMAYRMNVLIRSFSYLISIFIQISIWRALYDGSEVTSTTMGDVTLGEMITYVLISTFVSIWLHNVVILRVENKVRSGEIAMDLIKPVSLKSLLLCEAVGDNLFKGVFQLLPLLALGLLLFGLDLPGWQHGLLFCVSLLNAFVLYFLMTLLVGLVAFWYMSIWHVGRFLGDLIGLFSGSVIPLWFFPEALLRISEWLPFRLLYFTTISIYLERIALSEALSLILQQWLWIGVLVLAERVVWGRAVRKLVLQGG